MKYVVTLLPALMAAMITTTCVCQLPPRTIVQDATQRTDWLVSPVKQQANIQPSTDGKEIYLNNGLVKRSFRISPTVACFDYTNLRNGQQLLRALQPEAKLIIDGIEYSIGGLQGQREKAYLTMTAIDSLAPASSNFVYERYEISSLAPLLDWHYQGWMRNKRQASGKTIGFRYRAAAAALTGLVVMVYYDLYDGLPLISKRLSLHYEGSRPLKLDRVVHEVLGLVEEESAVVGSPQQMKTPQGIYLETNFAYNNSMRYTLSDQTTHWKPDSSYTSQVNYNYQTPCLLEIYPERSPGIVLQKGDSFQSVRTFELLQDSYDRQRRGMAIQRLYSTIAPWTTANPIFMHLVSRNDEQVRTAIDQCVATGYEAVILSFGSHINMEDTSASNIRHWKALSEYAHQRGIKIGGYSLFSSRRISDADDVIDPKTGKPGGAFFGNAPCFGSPRGLAYSSKIKYFFAQTGFDIWENDGPYPGDVCASTTHPGHQGLDDSQWRQMAIQKDLYHWLNARGVYINAPDWYLLDGTHKISIGYREVNFSLPRDNQKILNRQNIYDGTWDMSPSMGWGFVPLTRYQGGGPEAILEPLSEHLKDYEQLMMQYYGAGVQACYRGPRLYDTEATRAVVARVISWYKQYRDILNAPLVHLRRADGRDWDGWLHVDPLLKTNGLLMLFNPTSEPITRTIEVPLYYAGATDRVVVREKGSKAQTLAVNRNYSMKMTVTLPANGWSWWTLEKVR
ncbi:alpha-galactosidase [Paraflavitalea pollutisoli]|uniref:alpha-galactosidase n=1 Tax=Paraflavitalea pollutisoli TaxID=3034143 RepID=UPI0023EAED29|nr:alpha-galactosidase [Paraflavitalea sp. H1-2-19X]